jgi:hypothetical protein
MRRLGGRLAKDSRDKGGCDHDGSCGADRTDGEGVGEVAAGRPRRKEAADAALDNTAAPAAPPISWKVLTSGGPLRR